MPDIAQIGGLSLSEEEIIRLVASLAGRGSPGLVQGMGDDCAVVEVGGVRICVTTDMLVEGVHFDLAYLSPFDLGWRAMAANLSDLAAMGAVPLWGFLSLGLAQGSRAFVQELIAGLDELGKKHGLVLAGGDTVKAPLTVLNLCLLGRADPPGPILRSGARAGDAVCVTGHLGSSAGGLAWLKNGGSPDDPRFASLARAHARPLPRLAAGRALAASGRVHAMMDLSDGLASDLSRLSAASGLGAEVRAGDLPIKDEARELAGQGGADPVDWALCGGEDFELLFTCAPEQVKNLARDVAAAEPGLGVTQVGRLAAGAGVRLTSKDGTEKDITMAGYDHFRPKEPA